MSIISISEGEHINLNTVKKFRFIPMHEERQKSGINPDSEGTTVTIPSTFELTFTDNEKVTVSGDVNVNLISTWLDHQRVRKER